MFVLTVELVILIASSNVKETNLQLFIGQGRLEGPARQQFSGPHTETPHGHQKRSPTGSAGKRAKQQRTGSVYNENFASETHSMAGGGQNPDSKSLGDVGKYENI